MIVATTALWAAATAFADQAPWIAYPVVVLTIVLHSSLQHEALHGHPTPWQGLNAALVTVSPGLFVPYARFRDTHLAHHRDERLTDPYDDPETNYLDPEVWARLPAPLRAIYLLNNTLMGRILLGPAISVLGFWRADLAAMIRGDRAILMAWGLHALGLAPVIAWLWAWGAIPWPAYIALAYAGLGVLKIRTFLEHRAHRAARGRSVIVEDRGPLAFLFLNNNLHAVHHGHPGLAWYKLPEKYQSGRARFLEMNDGYVYSSYLEVFSRHFIRRKDPVAHPLFTPRK